MIKDKLMREVEKQAHAGPWHTFLCNRDIIDVTECAFKQGALSVPIFTATMHEVDADFIAAAREWVPDTLNRLDRIRALIDPTKATPGSTAHKILQILDEETTKTNQPERKQS